LRVSIIVACDRNGTIGADGGMPWHLPDDLKRFKKLTMGKPIVMGRKTYESIGKPLPGRRSIVVTRRGDFRAPGCETVRSPDAALEAALPADEAFVIGGGEIYTALIDRADAIYMTLIDAEIAGDTTFPAIDAAEWSLVDRKDHPPDDRHRYGFAFLTLEKRPGDSR